jgi:hypothetical protein
MSDDQKPIGDQIKQALDDLDLEAKMKAAAAAAEDALYRGLGAAGQYVHERRDDIESFLDRAATGIDEQTGRRFSDQVGGLRDSLSASVASLADKRPMSVPDDVSELDAPDAPTDGPTDSWSDTTDDPSDPETPTP